MADRFNRFDAWIVRGLKCAAVLVLIIVGFLQFVAWIVPPPPPRTAPVFSEAERRTVAERMRYHGIERAELDAATGERYFWRNGSRCKL